MTSRWRNDDGSSMAQNQKLRRKTSDGASSSVQVPYMEL